MKTLTFVLFLIALSSTTVLSAMPDYDEYEKALKNIIENCKSESDVLPEPFPVESFDLVGLPVFRGFSNPSLKDVTVEICVLAACSKNSKLIEHLKERVKSGDSESALALFAIATRVLRPEQREETYSFLGDVLIPRLPVYGQDRFDQKLKLWNPALLYAICKYCYPKLQKTDKRLYERLLAESAPKVDAAYATLLEYYAISNKVEELNDLIAINRKDFVKPERKIFIDSTSPKYTSLVGVDWKLDPIDVVLARLNSEIKKHSNFMVAITCVKMDVRNDPVNAKIVTKLLTAQEKFFIPYCYQRTMDFYSSDVDKSAFWAYMIVRSDFSLPAFEVLFNCFYQKKDFKNAQIILEFVKASAGRKDLRPANEEIPAKDAVDFWCQMKEGFLRNRLNEKEMKASEEEVKKLLKIGYYENPWFETAFQNCISL